MKRLTINNSGLGNRARAASRITHHASRFSSPVTRHPSRSGAFSLIELLITMGLLSLIVMFMLQMFNQTQRAFRTGMSQTDMLESGRAITDLMQREIEQMTPSQLPGVLNFLAEFSPPPRLGPTMFSPVVFLQNLPPGTGVQRENVLEQFFFLTRENQDWKGIGYLVRTNAVGVGTLYRFESDKTRTDFALPLGEFQAAAVQLYQNNQVLPSLTRVADGVCHLRLTAYDARGFELMTPYLHPSIAVTNAPLPAIPGKDFEYCFYSNAVPASVELEIGFLEDRPQARLRSIPDPTAQANYLQDRAAQIHLFRQRIPIRAVDTSVYP